MDIYVLRHGEAEPRGKNIAEADRKLTPKGRRDVDRVARLARRAKVAPDIILTSPYARALETANIAAAAFDPVPPLSETKALLPNVRPEQVWKEVRSHAASRQLVLVGHEPQLSRLAAYLLAVPNLKFDLKKGALVRISMDKLEAQPHGELKWVLTPALARARHA